MKFKYKSYSWCMVCYECNYNYRGHFFSELINSSQYGSTFRGYFETLFIYVIIHVCFFKENNATTVVTSQILHFTILE